MFFHIDESGNTGNNLFDQNQPLLSYGVLSSKTNVDALGVSLHKKILKKIGHESIHANLLGVDQLTQIFPLLLELQLKMKFKLDYYFIDKLDYALVHFFDAVFDAGLNPAVKWDTYWTPLRFVFIRKLAELIDVEMLRISWSLCLEKNIEKREEEIVSLLKSVLERVSPSPLDDRSKELMDAAFRYGINNPLAMDFGRSEPKMVSPNAVCFQFVVTSIARSMRASRRKEPLGITVDKQSQFNKSQITTFDRAYLVSDSLKNSNVEIKRFYTYHPLFRHLDERDVLGVGVPKNTLQVKDSQSSIGLQIVDVYLWIANRVLTKKSLSDELKYLSGKFLGSSLIDGISMEGMLNRWNQFEQNLPALEDLSDEIKALCLENQSKHREIVKGLRADGSLYVDSLVS